MSTITEKIRQMRKETKQNETKLSTGSSRRGSYVGVQDLQEGKTTIRIVKHPKDEIPFVPFRSTWLEVNESILNLSRYHLNNIIKEQKLEKALGVSKIEDLKEKSDDDVRTLLMNELGADYSRKVNKRIFISKIHGNPEIADLVEEYIKFANEHFKSVCQDTDELKNKLASIRGYRDKSGKWISGIMPSTSYVCHMINLDSQDKDIQRFEIWESHMNEIEKLYAAYDDESSPLTVDPFSHESEGVPLVFDKYKDEKGKTVYSISDKKNVSRSATFMDFVKQFALTSEQIDQINQSESLTDIYVEVYSKRDFELAMAGLQVFDEKHNLNLFENDNFLEIVETIAMAYDKEEPVKEEPKIEKRQIEVPKVEKKVEKKVGTTKSEPKGKPAPVASKEEPKKPVETKTLSPYGNTIDELKAYIAENSLGIRITPRFTFEDIVEMIEDVEKEMNEESGGLEVVEQVSEENEVINAEIIAESFPEPEEEIKPKINIADLRARLNKGLGK